MSRLFLVVRSVNNAFGRVPVNSVIRLKLVFTNEIVDITIFRRSFVFSLSYRQISASLTYVIGLTVASFAPRLLGSFLSLTFVRG